MSAKQIYNNLSDYSGKAVKVLSVQGVVLTVLISQVLVLWLSTKGSLFPGEEALQQIIGTCAEVVAGLYGITLAGYTFFLSRIDALTAADTTLDYVTDSIKTRFKYLIWYITATVATTLLISLVLMYYPASSNLIPEYMYRLICNNFVVFLCFSVSLILYYSLNVIDPNCIPKEAAKLKKRLCIGSSPDGSVSEFIALYDRIEARCNSMIPQNVLHQLHENKGNRFAHTISLLQEQHPEMGSVFAELTRIHRYYGCMVNCSTMQVSQQMCIRARSVLAFLENHPTAIQNKGR